MLLWLLRGSASLPPHPVSLSTETRSSAPWSRPHGTGTGLDADPYIGLVDPVGFVGGPKMWPTAFIEFRCIRLDPRQMQLASTASPHWVQLFWIFQFPRNKGL